MKQEHIYLDSHATTRVDRDVLHCMMPYFTEHYGNGNHALGWKSDAAIENARVQVGQLIGAKPSEFIFTSGATEAINLGLLGLAKNNDSGRNHIISQKTEHAAVLQTLQQLEQEGYKITLLDVDPVGRIKLEDLKEAISENTFMVAIMLSNNEIGTIQPIHAIGEICKKWGSLFFCDLTQGVGWYNLNLQTLPIDLAAFSSHKIYGPRGAGALFGQKKLLKKLAPIMYGGGQEKGLRPGTVNLPAIVGFGKACEIAFQNAKNITPKIETLRNYFQDRLFSAIPGIRLNGCPENRHPGNLNISIDNVSGEELAGQLPQLIFSNSSACTNNKTSHVLAALPNKSALANEKSLRFGIGKYNTAEQIDLAAQKIINAAHILLQKKARI